MRALVALLLLTTAARADAPGPPFGAPYVFTEQGGEAIYRNVCASCHMPDGQGAIGAGAYPSLQNDPRLAAAGYPVGLILHGRNAMPSFARSLNDDQIAAVVTAIRTHFGNAYPDPVTAAEVKAARSPP